MKSILRAIGAALAGLLVTVVGLMAVEAFSMVVHPFPEGFKGTTEEICRHVEHYPNWVLGVVVPLWAATAFAGAWIARRIGNLYSFAIVGSLALAGFLFNITKLPYPMWFKVAIALSVPAAIFAASWIVTRHKSAATVKAV